MIAVSKNCSSSSNVKAKYNDRQCLGNIIACWYVSQDNDQPYRWWLSASNITDNTNRHHSDHLPWCQTHNNTNLKSGWVLMYHKTSCSVDNNLFSQDANIKCQFLMKFLFFSQFYDKFNGQIIVSDQINQRKAWNSTDVVLEFNKQLTSMRQILTTQGTAHQSQVWYH